MASVIYHVAHRSFITATGALEPGEPKEVPSAELAQRRAASLAQTRSGDLETGDLEDAVILSQCRDADLVALSA